MEHGIYNSVFGILYVKCYLEFGMWILNFELWNFGF